MRIPFAAALLWSGVLNAQAQTDAPPSSDSAQASPDIVGTEAVADPAVDALPAAVETVPEPAALAPAAQDASATPSASATAEPPADMPIADEAAAAPNAAEVASRPCHDWTPLDEQEMIEGTQRYLHESLCSTSLWLDGLFGEQRNVEAARGVHGRLETSFAHSEFYGEKFRTRLNVRVDLPNLQKRTSAFLGRDDEDQFVRDRSEGFALRTDFPRIEDQDAWLAGLGYSLPSSKRFKADVRVGVRNVREPRAFAQSRVRYIVYADSKNLVHARLTPFWNTRDGFGITPGVDYSRVLSQTRLVRWSNIGTISDRSEDFDWRSALILYQSLGNERGIAFESFLRGGVRQDVSVREYGLRSIYRQPLVRDKLFGELVTGYSWPKSGPGISRDGSYLIGISLEMPFGKHKEEEQDPRDNASSIGEEPAAAKIEISPDPAPLPAENPAQQ